MAPPFRLCFQALASDLAGYGRVFAAALTVRGRRQFGRRRAPRL